MLFNSGKAQPWSVVIPEDSIKIWVESFLRDHLEQSNYVRYTIEKIKVPAKIMLPVQQYRYILKNRQNKWRGNVVLTIQIVDANEKKIYKTFTVYARVKTYQPVLKASTNIQKGDTLSPENVVMDTVETTSLRQGYLHRWEQIEATIAVRNIRKNEILYSRFIKGIPIIKKGERITLMYHQPPLLIKVIAIALQDGKVGDWIWVRNVQSNKRLKAKVVAAGIATVQ